MMRIVAIWRYSCLRCDLVKCVKWYVKCLILNKYGEITNILYSKDNISHCIGLLNPKNIGADIDIMFLLHLVLEISLLLQLQNSCCCGHLGGHLEFWSLHNWDSRGLLICYLWVYYGFILKKLACYAFCSPPTLMLLDYKHHRQNSSSLKIIITIPGAWLDKLTPEITRTFNNHPIIPKIYTHSRAGVLDVKINMIDTRNGRAIFSNDTKTAQRKIMREVKNAKDFIEHGTILG